MQPDIRAPYIDGNNTGNTWVGLQPKWESPVIGMFFLFLVLVVGEVEGGWLNIDVFQCGYDLADCCLHEALCCLFVFK